MAQTATPAPLPELSCRVTDTLEQVPAGAWNALAGPAQPFLRHEFLLALEQTGCVGAGTGWHPRHLLLHAGEKLVGAAPMYLKTHSYGEFVFDWSWAEAYARAGRDYYPKLISAVPFTPVTGPRLLIDPTLPGDVIRGAAGNAALEVAERMEASSVHWLFTSEPDSQALAAAGYVLRAGCQFHWRNPGFRDFQDYLDSLRSKKRKQIRRERREAERSGLEIEVLSGADLEETHCDAYHELYSATYDRKWGYPSLSREFFHSLRQSLADALVLVLARRGRRYVAGAHLLRGQTRLFGRNWGRSEYHPCVHFEVCYYRPMEYAIARGLEVFEAGAQGEHKLSRGFLPVATWSAHGLLDADFRRAVAEFTRREQAEIRAYIEAMGRHSPYHPSRLPASPAVSGVRSGPKG
ncbi:MAG: GNAT family N-acetyltransferase [Gammaproteobacteria bacterium]|nr:GNAT family N-acetyltransferase [Gammaproteobacteria bacterium]